MINIIRILDILKAIIFGIIEGITEWLPISSTGHLIIFESILNVTNIYGKDFWELFLVVIQLGAICAVLTTFFKKINPFIKENKRNSTKIYKLWIKVILACIPSAIIGLLFNDYVELYFNNSIVVSITLIIYGIIFIIVENFNKNKTFKVNNIYEISYLKAFLIGCFQTLALIPGTSRSGITIIGAMILLCNREVATEFSFYLSIPVMFGASLLKCFKFITKGNILLNEQLIFLIVGSLCAFIISIIAIKFLMSYIKKHDFKFFGYYRIGLGIIILLLYFLNII